MCFVYCIIVELYGIDVNTGIELESIPKHCLLPTDVMHLNQVCGIFLLFMFFWIWTFAFSDVHIFSNVSAQLQIGDE